MRKRFLRSDALPEHSPYKDDGCEVAPKCVECPLPQCRYEVKGGLRALLNVVRDAELIKAKRNGANIDTLATEFGVSRRTVFRVLEAKDDRTDTELDVLVVRVAPLVRRQHRDRQRKQEPDGEVQRNLPLWMRRKSLARKAEQCSCCGHYFVAASARRCEPCRMKCPQSMKACFIERKVS